MLTVTFLLTETETLRRFLPALPGLWSKQEMKIPSPTSSTKPQTEPIAFYLFLCQSTMALVATRASLAMAWLMLMPSQR